MPVRVGVVGCGTAARRIHLPALRAAGADVVAFASRSRDSSNAACAEWGGGRVIADWRDLVGDAGVDAVVVATPNALHADVAVAAASAGKHVLVDKPMAPTVEECDAMTAAAESAGVLLVPTQTLRDAPPYAAVAEKVRSGEIGEVVAVRAALGHRGPQDWAPEARWFFDRAEAGGGAMIDLGVHVADALRFVTGDEAVEVSAAMREPPDGTVEVSGIAIVRMASDALATLSASWESQRRDNELTVFGTAGVARLERDGAPSSARASVHAGFLRAIETGEPPTVNASDGRAAVAIICAAYESARSGRSVRVL